MAAPAPELKWLPLEPGLPQASAFYTQVREVCALVSFMVHGASRDANGVAAEALSLLKCFIETRIHDVIRFQRTEPKLSGTSQLVLEQALNSLRGAVALIPSAPLKTSAHASSSRSAPLHMDNAAPTREVDASSVSPSPPHSVTARRTYSSAFQNAQRSAARRASARLSRALATHAAAAAAAAAASTDDCLGGSAYSALSADTPSPPLPPSHAAVGANLRSAALTPPSSSPHPADAGALGCRQSRPSSSEAHLSGGKPPEVIRSSPPVPVGVRPRSTSSLRRTPPKGDGARAGFHPPPNDLTPSSERVATMFGRSLEASARRSRASLDGAGGSGHALSNSVAVATAGVGAQVPGQRVDSLDVQSVSLPMSSRAALFAAASCLPPTLPTPSFGGLQRSGGLDERPTSPAGSRRNSERGERGRGSHSHKGDAHSSDSKRVSNRAASTASSGRDRRGCTSADRTDDRGRKRDAKVEAGRRKRRTSSRRDVERSARGDCRSRRRRRGGASSGRTSTRSTTPTSSPSPSTASIASSAVSASSRTSASQRSLRSLSSRSGRSLLGRRHSRKGGRSDTRRNGTTHRSGSVSAREGSGGRHEGGARAHRGESVASQSSAAHSQSRAMGSRSVGGGDVPAVATCTSHSLAAPPPSLQDALAALAADVYSVARRRPPAARSAGPVAAGKRSGTDVRSSLRPDNTTTTPSKSPSHARSRGVTVSGGAPLSHSTRPPSGPRQRAPHRRAAPSVGVRDDKVEGGRDARGVIGRTPPRRSAKKRAIHVDSAVGGRCGVASEGDYSARRGRAVSCGEDVVSEFLRGSSVGSQRSARGSSIGQTGRAAQVKSRVTAKERAGAEELSNGGSEVGGGGVPCVAVGETKTSIERESRPRASRSSSSSSTHFTRKSNDVGDGNSDLFDDDDDGSASSQSHSSPSVGGVRTTAAIPPRVRTIDEMRLGDAGFRPRRRASHSSTSSSSSDSGPEQSMQVAVFNDSRGAVVTRFPDKVRVRVRLDAAAAAELLRLKQLAAVADSQGARRGSRSASAGGSSIGGAHLRGSRGRSGSVGSREGSARGAARRLSLGSGAASEGEKGVTTARRTQLERGRE